jgi:hypothetical protein
MSYAKRDQAGTASTGKGAAASKPPGTRTKGAGKASSGAAGNGATGGSRRRNGNAKTWKQPNSNHAQEYARPSAAYYPHPQQEQPKQDNSKSTAASGETDESGEAEAH